MSSHAGVVHDSRVYQPADMSWHPRGACRDEDDTLFFHPEGERGGPRRRRAEAAKAICRACPVMAECLEGARSRREIHGTWGGESEDERRAWLKDHPTEKPDPEPEPEPESTRPRYKFTDGDPCLRCGAIARVRRTGRQIADGEVFHTGQGLCEQDFRIVVKGRFSARWEITELGADMTLAQFIDEACDGRVQDEVDRQRVELLREPRLMSWRIDSARNQLVVSGPARALERGREAAA